MPGPTITLPDPELQPAIDKLRAVGVIGASVQLSDGRTLVYRGGPFGSVEIVEYSTIHLPKVTRRADGAYTAGPPPDGRSVDEHLDELARNK